MIEHYEINNLQNMIEFIWFDLSIHWHGTYLTLRVMYTFVSLVRLHWEKKGAVFHSKQLEIVSGLGIGTCTHFLSQPRDPIWLRLV